MDKTGDFNDHNKSCNSIISHLYERLNFSKKALWFSVGGFIISACRRQDIFGNVGNDWCEKIRIAIGAVCLWICIQIMAKTDSNSCRTITPPLTTSHQHSSDREKMSKWRPEHSFSPVLAVTTRETSQKPTNTSGEPDGNLHHSRFRSDGSENCSKSTDGASKD